MAGRSGHDVPGRLRAGGSVPRRRARRPGRAPLRGPPRGMRRVRGVRSRLQRHDPPRPGGLRGARNRAPVRTIEGAGGTSMIVALEIVAGLVLTAALVTGTLVLTAFELGRLVTMDDDQREVERVVRGATVLKRAA